MTQAIRSDMQGIYGLALMEEKINGVRRKVFEVAASMPYGSNISPRQVTGALLKVKGKGSDAVIIFDADRLVSGIKRALGKQVDGVITAVEAGILAGDGTVVYHIVIPRGTATPDLVQLHGQIIDGVRIKISVVR